MADHLQVATLPLHPPHPSWGPVNDPSLLAAVTPTSVNMQTVEAFGSSICSTCAADSAARVREHSQQPSTNSYAKRTRCDCVFLAGSAADSQLQACFDDYVLEASFEGRVGAPWPLHCRAGAACAKAAVHTLVAICPIAAAPKIRKTNQSLHSSVLSDSGD
jgi:hypothetical protein